MKKITTTRNRCRYLLTTQMLKTTVMKHCLTRKCECTRSGVIDIYDSNTGTEAATVVFNMANATQTGVNREAGLYAFSA
jgi:hypothetical protein